MQISSNSNTYDVAQMQRAMAGQAPPETDADGQTSPTAEAQAGPAAAPQAPASLGAQFDASTLGGLIALQQEQQQQQVQQHQGQGQDSDGASWASTGHAHRHHHGHGMHKAGGEAEQGEASNTADQSAATTTQGA